MCARAPVVRTASSPTWRWRATSRQNRKVPTWPCNREWQPASGQTFIPANLGIFVERCQCFCAGFRFSSCWSVELTWRRRTGVVWGRLIEPLLPTIQPWSRVSCAKALNSVFLLPPKSYSLRYSLRWSQIRQNYPRIYKNFSVTPGVTKS